MEIGSVFVQPYYNGRGIGRKLVNDACEKAYQKGYRLCICPNGERGQVFSIKMWFYYC